MNHEEIEIWLDTVQFPTGGQSFDIVQFDKWAWPEHYKTWVEIRRVMTIHTQGACPMDIIIRRHTREDEECYAWRKKNIGAISKPAMRKAISRLTTILADSGYYLKVSESLDEILKKRNFYGSDFFLFFQKNILQTMIEDPNGFLVWEPVTRKEYETEEDYVFTVKPILVCSDNVRYYDEKHLIFLSDEKSYVTVINQKEKKGNIYHLHTPKGIYRISQYGSQHENKYEISEFYQTNFEYATFIQFGGDWTTDGYYESYFSAFVPFANEALKQFSDYQVIMANCAYPIKEVTPIACTNRDCHNGQLEDLSDCKTCHGTGFMPLSGPFATVVRQQQNPMADGTVDQRPMISYITPPTDIIQYAQQAWEKLLEQAEKALNLNFVREPQSGIAKTIDREDMYAMLQNIAANVYNNLMYFSLYFLEAYYAQYESREFEAPVVQMPVSFNIKTEHELQSDYDTYIKDGVSTTFTHLTAKDLANKKFSADGKASKMVDFLANYDPLIYDSPSAIQSKLAMFAITIDDVIRHTRSNQILNRLIYQFGDDWFLQTDFDKIATEMEAQLKPFLPKIIPNGV